MAGDYAQLRAAIETVSPLGHNSLNISRGQP